MAFPRFFDPMLFGAELVFTIIAVVFCFLIYIKTKESYELTRHKGIKYFRGAFLFFGLSYALRFLFSIVLLSSITFDFIVPRGMFAPLFILSMGYFSTISIFYLIFSSIWKEFNNRNLLVMGHSITLLLSIASFFTRSHILLFYFQSALLIFGAILILSLHKHEKKISGIRILYFLVSALWLINLFIIGKRRAFSFEIEILFEVISLAVFLSIYYRVSKWVR